jgi:adenosylcobinamide-GDP ribazoletransferase
MVVLTSGLHLDGLMDTCDGLGGATKEKRLVIMSDARTGAFGVAACVVVLLLKWTALSILPDSVRMESLLLAPVLSRWTMVGAIWAFPYARPEGLGSAFKTHVTWRLLLLATVLALGAAGGWMLWQGLVMAAVAVVIAAILAILVVRRLGGLTGDVYGAINEVGEVTVLAGLPLVAKLG